PAAQEVARPYYRRDQRNGISPPDLSKTCTYAEHIVHARGKRTQFTSVSLDATKIRDFGDTTYQLKREEAERDGTRVMEQEYLCESLRQDIREKNKAEKALAVQALRYATKRKEGLVQWAFDWSSVARKQLITWAQARVQDYFTRL